MELKNTCDDCEWVVSEYSYTYDNRGFIVGVVAIESLAGYAYDDKHNGKHTDGKHDDLYPHGTKHAKHDKDATFAYQIVETDRTFVYDDAGKLLQAIEIEDNYGTYTYNYEYDLMGNRTYMEKVDADGDVAEWHKYVYNDSNQLVSEKLYNGKKTTSLTYKYDADGNRISETGRIGTDKVEKTYEYTVENRLAAVYDADELLIAAAYDGDGNRVFQLNYNLHTDEDWKENSGNGNGNDKDNNSDANLCSILFPENDKVNGAEQDLIDKIKSTGKQKNYELIEYINDVNREYTEVLVEQNQNGELDSAYTYGVERLSIERHDGSTSYYLYDPRGSVTGITNEEGQIYQSYRYDANGAATFGAPTYENEYTYNGESYNPNIESQYLRARYCDVVTAVFYTEDTYLGNIIEPLTLNRYNYCVSSPLNYMDPSGNSFEWEFKTTNEYTYIRKFEKIAMLDISFDKCEESEESLSEALEGIKFEQHNWLMNIKAKYSVQSALDIIQENEEILNELSEKYVIPKEYIQAMLFRELRCYDIRDDIADGIVRQNIMYDEAVQTKDYRTLMYTKPALVGNRDSSTGIGQIFARTAIKAINVGIELDLVSKEELGISNEVELDVDNQDSISYIWKRLNSEDKFNIEVSTLNLISEAYKRVGNIEFDTFGKEDIISMYTGYNGEARYGKAVYQIYEVFEKYKE